MSKINVEYWFPTPIWNVDLDIDNEILSDTCLKLKEDNLTSGRTLSNRGGWQSQDLFVEHNISVFSPLMLKITDVLNDILITDYEVADRTAVISHYWINVNSRGDVNQVHIHPGSFLSGVYYISAPENSGNIHFERDAKEIYSMGIMKISGKTPVSGTNCEYPPKPGRLLVFPGWLPHSVLQSESDEPRISIAFNSEIRSSTTFGGLI